MSKTLEYAITAMMLFIISVLIVEYIPAFWWIDIFTVPFGGVFALAVLERLNRGE
jgi:hypothetical protein